jgi:hypothetical protein
MKAQGVSIDVIFPEDLSSIYEFSWIITRENIPSFSLSLVDDQYRSLLNFSGYFYMSVRHNINVKVFANVRSTRTQSAILLALELAFGVFCSISIRNLIGQIIRTALNVIQTTQPSVMIIIGHWFDRLFLSSPQPTWSPKPSLPSMMLPMFVLFLVLSINPIVSLCVLSRINMVDPVPQMPDPAIFDWEHIMMIYSIAELESLLVQQGVLRICDDGCYHQIATEDYNVLMIPYNPLSVFDAVFTDLVHTVLLPLLTLGYFIWCCWRVEGVFAAATSIIMSYPTSLIPSHPVFSRLMLTSRVTSDDIHSFMHDIEHEPRPPEFLCFVEFDEIGVIVRKIGNVNELLNLNYYVRTINDFIVHLSPLHSDISSFFESKTDGASIKVASPDGHSICLTFSHSGRILSIQDDAHNVDSHRKQMLIQTMSKQIADFSVFPEAGFDRVALVGLAIDIDQIRELVEDVLLVDSRDHTAVFAFDLNGPHGLTPLAFVKAIHTQERPLTAVAHAGGPLRFFESKGPVSKPRCFGRVYDELKQLLRVARPGTVTVTQAFFVAGDMDYSEITFWEVRASEMPIQLAVLD